MIKNMKMKTALTIVISFSSILCLSFLYVTTQSGMTRLMKTSAKEKELLFTIAKVLRFKKSGESRLWIIKNVGNDPELTAKIYDICDPLSDTDARSIRERIREQ